MLLAIAAATAASLFAVDSIRIESRWGGLGTPSDQVYNIVRHDGRYLRRRTVVPVEAIDRFVSSLGSPAVGRTTALRTIATPQWLAAVAHQPHKTAGGPSCSNEARRLLERRLTDEAFAFTLLERYFQPSHTDDYPQVKVDVHFHDGRVLQIESHAQPALMLPWSVGGVETWNPELPRAIAALLPAGAEPRIAGENLESHLFEEAASELRYQLDPLEERCVHREFTAAVEKVFNIVHIYHGSPGWFTAYVRRTDFPPNLVLTLVIDDAEAATAAAKLARTVARTAMYVDVVRPYVAAHPQKNFALWCKDGTSVDRSEIYLVGDAEGRLKADADRAVRLLEYNPPTGIVGHERFILPDGTVIEESVP